jgi:hypothetical protein
MEALVPILMYVVIGLVLLGLGVIAIFGILGIARGKQKPSTLLALAIPIVVFAIAYAIMGNPPGAVILTVLILLALAVIAMVFTGLKGLVS